MTYEDTLTSLNFFLDSAECSQVFGYHRDSIKKNIGLIDKNVKELNQNKSPIFNPNDLYELKQSVYLIKEILLSYPITNGMRDFVIFYGNLLTNWINNCAKDEKEFLVDVDYTMRFVKYHFTVVEAISILPEMLDKMKSWSNISLPSIELARHYLGTLDEAMKKEK